VARSNNNQVEEVKSLRQLNKSLDNHQEKTIQKKNLRALTIAVLRRSQT
jgi:hypothetical protein